MSSQIKLILFTEFTMKDSARRYIHTPGHVVICAQIGDNVECVFRVDGGRPLCEYDRKNTIVLGDVKSREISAHIAYMDALIRLASFIEPFAEVEINVQNPLRVPTSDYARYACLIITCSDLVMLTSLLSDANVARGVYAVSSDVPSTVAAPSSAPSSIRPNSTVLTDPNAEINRRRAELAEERLREKESMLASLTEQCRRVELKYARLKSYAANYGVARTFKHMLDNETMCSDESVKSLTSMSSFLESANPG